MSAARSPAGAAAAPAAAPPAPLSPWAGVRLNVRNCPLCFAASPRLAGMRDDGIAFSQCTGCGLVYANPAPPVSAAQRLYQEDYFGVSGDPSARYRGYYDYLDSQRLADDPRRLEVQLLQRFAGEFRGKRSLEIGCGGGTLLGLLQREGAEVTGVELNPAAAQHARDTLGAKILEKPVETGTGLTGGSFDIILACSVLEHSADPGPFLNEVSRLAAPNALFLVITPRWECAARAGADWIGWRGQWDHLCYFSAPALNRALGLRGFEPLVLGAAGPPMSLRAVRQGRPVKKARRAFKRAPVIGPVAVKLKRRLFPPGLAPFDSDHADLVAVYRKTTAARK